MIKVTTTNIEGLKVIEPKIINDGRGFFFESFNQKNFNELVCSKAIFVQDNHSKSSQGVIRGLHYQRPPFEQAKLVRVVSGEIFDVAIDLRKSSKFFGKWFGLKLSSTNMKQLWIPKGFAHGFLVLSETAEIVYKTDQFYNHAYEGVISWEHKDIGINWDIPREKVILSNKDEKGFKGSLKNLV